MIKAEAAEKLLRLVGKKKYAVILALVGAALLTLPALAEKRPEKAEAPSDVPEFSVAAEEKRIADALSRADGAGRVTVVLSVSGSVRREIAENVEKSASDGKTEISEKAVTVQSGGSVQEAVTLRYENPEYTGALVIAEGAGSGRVRLSLTQAVSALTGLGSDRITVIKMKQ